MKYRKETKYVRGSPQEQQNNDRGKGHIREEKGTAEVGESLWKRDKESRLERKPCEESMKKHARK